MVTNVTLFPVDGPAVIYFQDGSSLSVDAQETKQFQIIEGGFVTISDPFPKDQPVSPEDGEHPPQQPPQWFIDAMIKFWTTFQELVKGPHVEPH